MSSTASIYRLTIYGADDTVCVEIPLTEEQAIAVRSTRTAPPDDPTFSYGEYQIDNVFFGTVAL